MKPGDLVWFNLNWEPHEYSEHLGLLLDIKSLESNYAGTPTYAEILYENKIWKISLPWVRPYKKEEDDEED